MEYVRLGKSGLKVSRLSLGCWNFGSPTPPWGKPGKVTPTDSFRIIREAIDLGINLFDNANRYTGGEAEEILGRAIKGRRHEVVVATKVHGDVGPGINNRGQSRLHIMQEVENSLRRLGTDYIDLYQAHNVDYETPLEESLRAYDDLIRQGKVRYIGCSNFPAWVLTKALWVSDVNKLASFISVQPNYSLANRVVEKELQPMCVDQGIGMILDSPMGGGILSGKYESNIPRGSRGAEEPAVAERAKKFQEGVQLLKDIATELGKTPAQVSLNWIVNRPAVSAAIIGVSKLEQLHENVGAVGWSLSEQQTKQIDEAFPV
ncbi:aldo/keto reductase [Paenibacillus sp. WQ 127069]|uniref:Aldo/keto reductase n=1 Tax=Paenibacillus baimaensis TaxID=2982185 RepID=A0ABT2UU89_9BACL|nr:aldo/keto reductase [Paenibacillus sp. WQ 127069]MCU6798238.1 aldo/keto reductase [Paenibacillus sp. WQ 127069]